MSEYVDHPIRFEVGRKYSDGRSEVFVRSGDETLHSDTPNLASAKSRGKFLEGCKAKLGGLLGDDLAAVESQLIELASKASQHWAGDVAPVARSREELVRARDAACDAALAAMPDEVTEAAERMLRDPRLVELVQADLGAIGIVGEEDLRLGAYAIGTSRKLDSPLAGIVLGPSSSGKSYVIERVADLFPTEAVLRSTDLSRNSLYYVEEDALVHRFVAVGERGRRDDDEQAEATRALREMISSRVLRKTIPEKSDTGGFTTRTIERHGPIAFIESTTLTRIFDEDRNRAILLSTDESPEQTGRVIAHTTRSAAGGKLDTAAIIQRHHALQRLLRRVSIRIPYAEAIGDRMPNGRPEARRAINHALAFISTVALLHQRQRHPAGHALEHGAVIDATLQDYAIARELLIPPLGRLLGSDVTPAIANFGRRVVQCWSGREFTAAQAAEKDETIKVSDVCRRYLNALAAAGVVEIVGVGRGGKSNAYKVIKDVPKPGAAWLPTVEELQDAGVERPTSPPASAGLSGRQLAEVAQSAGPPAETVEFWRPASAFRLDTAGRQLDSGRVEQDTLATSRNAGDQTALSPADGTDDRGDQGGSVPRVANDQPDRAGNACGRRDGVPILVAVEHAERTIRRALRADDEGTVWWAVRELAGRGGTELADAVEDEIRAEFGVTADAA